MAVNNTTTDLISATQFPFILVAAKLKETTQTSLFFKAKEHMNQSYIFKKIFCLALTSFPRSRADVTVAVSTISSESEISIPTKFITGWTKGIHCRITKEGGG